MPAGYDKQTALRESTWFLRVASVSSGAVIGLASLGLYLGESPLAKYHNTWAAMAEVLFVAAQPFLLVGLIFSIKRVLGGVYGSLSYLLADLWGVLLLTSGLVFLVVGSAPWKAGHAVLLLCLVPYIIGLCPDALWSSAESDRLRTALLFLGYAVNITGLLLS